MSWNWNLVWIFIFWTNLIHDCCCLLLCADNVHKDLLDIIFSTCHIYSLSMGCTYSQPLFITCHKFLIWQPIPNIFISIHFCLNSPFSLHSFSLPISVTPLLLPNISNNPFASQPYPLYNPTDYIKIWKSFYTVSKFLKEWENIVSFSIDKI